MENNLLGQRFNRLLVIQKTEKRQHRCIVWKCGNTIFVRSESLSSSNTGSCGCAQRAAVTKHGCATTGKETAEYKTWQRIRQRCSDPKSDNYKYYGGRGIKIHKSWLHSFENFLKYLKEHNMYPKPKRLSIDRINNNGNYCPGNIRWATSLQQRHNRRK